SQRQSVIEKKFNTIIDKIKSLPDNEILKIESLINIMTYSKGKVKGEIISPYLQKKAIEFLETTSLTNSNNQLKSFYMKIIKAKKAKQDYISKIRSVAQKSKKITKDQFKKAVNKMIKNNNEYSTEFVKLATSISNIETISLSAATEYTKKIITFLIGKPPNHWISTGTLSR
ncbi:2621_t:CDS:2, partial [Dentiscutata erythropus]